MFRRLYQKFSPKGVLDPDDINHWKEKILYTFIFISVFLIFIMCVMNFPYLIKNKYWLIIGTITIAYLSCLAMFFSPTIAYEKRAKIASFLVYLVGLAIIFSVGPFVAPREYLFLFSIMASILLGWPGAIVSILMNTSAFIGIGILIKIGFWTDSYTPTNPLHYWFQTATDLIFLNVCTTLFVTFLFLKIEKSDHEAKVSSKLLLIEQTNLMNSNKKLEEEFKERKQAEEEKLKIQKIAAEHEKLALVGQVAGKMAHDFNNVLGIIMGQTELALLKKDHHPETKKTLELVFNQTIRGKNLLKNLIAFARSSEPRHEFFFINEKIKFVLNLIQNDLEGIQIQEKDLKEVEVLADPGMIEHTLVNLFQNSIHALSQTDLPNIIVRSYYKDEMIIFEIEDNGCGIPTASN